MSAQFDLLPGASVRYLVNEIFESFQGEGSFGGTPAVFVRLQGCPVGCGWCDTKHTWVVDKANEITAFAMLRKTAESTPEFARMSGADIAAAVGRFRSRHVVITGGEPAHFMLRSLCEALSPRRVQVETSGTAPMRDLPDWVFVTCSPKIDMPGERLVRRSVVMRADEIKLPVRVGADIERFEQRYLPDVRAHVPIYLQPVDEGSPIANALQAIEWARERGWRVSLQTHKWLGAR